MANFLGTSINGTLNVTGTGNLVGAGTGVFNTSSTSRVGAGGAINTQIESFAVFDVPVSLTTYNRSFAAGPLYHNSGTITNSGTADYAFGAINLLGNHLLVTAYLNQSGYMASVSFLHNQAGPNVISAFDVLHNTSNGGGINFSVFVNGPQWTFSAGNGNTVFLRVNNFGVTVNISWSVLCFNRITLSPT
jgi:hypothetical protein